MSSTDFENDLVLITCASGKQGTALVPLLIGKWKRLRLAANSDASVKRLQDQYPDAEVVQADMLNPQDCHRIMANVTAVYHVGPSGHPHETQCGYNMIDAAIASGTSFKHFILSSVWPTQLRKLMNHDCKRLVEEYLMESKLSGYTILQPSHLFENTPVGMLMAQNGGKGEIVYAMPYNPTVKHSFTATHDLAEVTASVLEQREKHFFAVYPVISTMPVAYTEFLAILGQAMGREIRIEKKPFEEAVAFMAQRFGVEKDSLTMDVFERLLLYYEKRGLCGNPGVTEWLLGRKAIGCKEWAEMKVKEIRASSK